MRTGKNFFTKVFPRTFFGKPPISESFGFIFVRRILFQKKSPPPLISEPIPVSCGKRGFAQIKLQFRANKIVCFPISLDPYAAVSRI